MARLAGSLIASAHFAAATYTMSFLPAPQDNGFNNASLWSWGGGVLEVNGTYHLFASAFIGGCGLGEWGSNSVAIHATSNSPVGPFSFVERALPYYHHNVAPIRAPDGTFLIYSIGMIPDPVPANCSQRGGRPRLTHGFESIECWYAAGPYGPWQPVTGGMNGRNLFNGTNPSPAFDPSGNGTVYIASHDSASILVSVAPHWKGPYAPAVPLFDFTPSGSNWTGEDPFLWFDASIPNTAGGQGAWRCLFHAYDRSDSHHQVNVGGYAQSADESIFSSWTLQVRRRLGAA
jgi:hypothetical protein